MDHIDWIARDVVRRKPDYLIVLGDWMFLTLRYLSREYAGEELVQYMKARYEGDWSHLS